MSGLKLAHLALFGVGVAAGAAVTSAIARKPHAPNVPSKDVASPPPPAIKSENLKFGVPGLCLQHLRPSRDSHSLVIFGTDRANI
ncbi:uncharacterized protein EI90DRAFT_3043642 [Cantharellus anzutake]|uniref:uncharacterized protein n=1 Tax=Cantharellus anzutake TaxID=1750568 RepID=UPI001907028D|nr:uncharacterized protein EI90DRAFT_3043642 [Cantharellus anzutake]KAF8337630.1 hypothetical protein EI90DRAFT_3043642 [Cantharellus anzutake]